MYRIRCLAGRSAILYILLSCQKRNAETRNYPFAQDAGFKIPSATLFFFRFCVKNLLFACGSLENNPRAKPGWPLLPPRPNGNRSASGR